MNSRHNLMTKIKVPLAEQSNVAALEEQAAASPSTALTSSKQSNTMVQYNAI